MLDVACGTGYGSAMLADAGAASVVGVDLSDEAVAQSRRDYVRPNLSFQQGDAQKLSQFPDASFDAVISFETIEHVPDDAAYLSAVHRVLRPEGLYIVSTPDGRLESTLYGLTGKPRNGHHLREYVRNGFEALLSRSFRVEQLYGQVFVKNFLRPWFVQVALKGSERITRPTGLLRKAWEVYQYGNGTDIRPAAEFPNATAKYWVAVCRKD